jgi:hypothetical protein
MAGGMGTMTTRETGAGFAVLYAVVGLAGMLRALSGMASP